MPVILAFSCIYLTILYKNNIIVEIEYPLQIIIFFGYFFRHSINPEVFYIRKFSKLSVVLGIVMLLSSCQAQAKDAAFSDETFLMDTVVTQTVYGKNGEKIVNDAVILMKNIENTYSSYMSDSITAKINENAGISPISVSSEELNIIKRCVEFSAQSDGLFDLTVAPLVKLWNITGDSPKVPSDEEIAKAQTLIDYRDVVIDEDDDTVYLSRPNMQLDFGATVKGYAVQKVLELYRQSGISGGILSLGGNVAAFGEKPDGSPFRIGIRDPQKTASDYFAVLELNDKVIATSGAYERYFEQDGKIYHHILNPKTGYPCESDLLSVTVISEDGLLCDFLSTLFYMQGRDAVINHLDESSYSLIALDQDGKIYISPRLQEYFTLLDSSPYAFADQTGRED